MGIKITFVDDAFDAMLSIIEHLCEYGFNVKVQYTPPPIRGVLTLEGVILECDDDSIKVLVTNPVNGDEEEKSISFDSILEIEVQ